MATGTVTITQTLNVSARVKKIKWAWTSTAGGAASDVTTEPVYGRVIALVTDPDGTDVPTVNYDITITDSESYDVMQGAGANRSDTATETAVPTAASVAFGLLTLNVTAAGNAKKGTAVLYVDTQLG